MRQYMNNAIYLVIAFCMALMSTTATADYVVREEINQNIVLPDSVTGRTVNFDFSNTTGSANFIAVVFNGFGPCNSNAEGTDVALEHGFMSDIRATLVSPTGVEVILFQLAANSNGGRNLCDAVFSSLGSQTLQEADRLDAPFPGYWLTEEELTPLLGQEINGTWQIKFQDVLPRDSGILHQVALYIEQEQTPTGNAPPVLSFETPESNGSFNGPVVEFTGTAFDFENALASVEYSIDVDNVKGATQFTQADNDSGDWTEWSFDVALPENVEATVSVRAIDQAGNISPISLRTGTTEFIIENAPELIITSPPSENTVNVAPGTTQVTLQGTSEAFDGALNDFIRVNNQQRIDTIDIPTPNESEFNNLSLTVNFASEISAPGDVQTFDITSVDSNGTPSNTVRRNFRISENNNAPVIVITDPENPRRFLPTNVRSYDILGTASDSDGFISDVQVRTFTETMFNNMTFVTPTDWESADDDSENSDFSEWSYLASNLSEGTNVFELRALDNVNKASQLTTRTFVIDPALNSAPRISVTEPVGNPTVASDVSLFTIIGEVETFNIPLTDFDVTVTQNDGTIIEPTISITPDQEEFNFIIELGFGVNTVNISATNEIALMDDVSFTITRQIPNVLPPQLTIVFPANQTQIVANSVSQISVSGTTVDGESPIESVVYQTGENFDELGPELTATNVSGNFDEWRVVLPLALQRNVIRVTAVAEDGDRSDIRERVIFRRPTTPEITIVSPADGSTFPLGTPTVPVDGTLTDPDGGVTAIQYRVFAASDFNTKNFSTKDIVSGEALKGIEPTRYFNAVDTSAEGDWTSFTFNAPVGDGNNVIEVRAYNSIIDDGLSSTEFTVILPRSDIYIID